MSADFSRLLAAIGEDNIAHADRDALTGVRRAVFLSRGGHAPEEMCPSEAGESGSHEYWCGWPDDECDCPGGRL